MRAEYRGRLLMITATTATLIIFAGLSIAAAADDKVPLGGGAGITVNGNTVCTLTSIGHDRTGDLVGFTAGHCGGPGAEVAAQSAEERGTLGTVTATNDYLDYAVIKFDPVRVTPLANFDGFAISGIGPDPAPGQPVCKLGSATGRDCYTIRPFLDSRPDRPISRMYASWLPSDDGGPITADDQLVGMIHNGFFLIGPPNPGATEIRVIYISAILADANANGGAGAGFTPGGA